MGRRLEPWPTIGCPWIRRRRCLAPGGSVCRVSHAAIVPHAPGLLAYGAGVAHDALPTPFAEEVLDIVGEIPTGRVMSYSDIASALARGGPRQVGQAMARFGSGVPWWRVLRADGSCAEIHRDEQVGLLRKERVAFIGDRVDMACARWRPGGAVGP